jgi:type IV pilus assembly protein PilX
MHTICATAFQVVVLARQQWEPSSAKQRGTVLVFSLLMLLLLTILGVTAVTTSSLQEKMAGNMRDQYVAAHAGDSILRDGEAWLFTQTSRPSPVCAYSATDKAWDFSCLSDVTAATDSWWTSNGFVPALAISQTSQPPRYVVEWLQDVPDSPAKTLNYDRGKEANYYRIDGWSLGATNAVHGVLQDTYRKRFN